MPTILAVGSQKAKLHLEGLAGSQAFGPLSPRRFDIIWMDDRYPIDLSCVLARDARVFLPGSIGKIARSIGQVAGDDGGDGIDGRLQVAACTANFLLRPLLLRDVGIALQDRGRLPPLAPPQGPPACDGHRRPIALGVDDLPVPAAGPDNLREDFLEGLRKVRLQQLVRDLAERLVCAPAVQLLGAAVPIGDDVVHVAHQDRVVRKVKKAGLPHQRCGGFLIPQREERGNADGEQAHQAPQKGRVGAQPVRD